MKRAGGKEALIFKLSKEIKSSKNKKIKEVLRMLQVVIESFKETEIKKILLLIRYFAKVLAESKQHQQRDENSIKNSHKKYKSQEVYHECIS
jgi:hypothetical protein